MADKSVFLITKSVALVFSQLPLSSNRGLTLNLQEFNFNGSEKVLCG